MSQGTLYTYSGKIAFPDGAPSLLDTAVSLSREGRYAGAGLRFWPVALHTFVVCDLLPERFKFDGLMHDTSEVITGDVPKPAKTAALEEFEEELLRVNYKAAGVTFPDRDTRLQVKIADNLTLRGEVYTVGTQALQEFYPRYEWAEEFVQHYAGKYSYADYLEPTGRVPTEFMRRYHKYRDMLPKERLIA
jgi:hypothetical protein